ncbi:MAG: hypothetical protein FRX48_02018 [Lasallia pustulata]|uniref:DUF3669 domain-containing protein n=1 Tax=Lasallia pustulata TaxID=136370 RepID=A0A5M8PVL7_9LECA|nr:MAG: hypothetical protein FRX48_02018 [Lasallia pustulata]
MPQLVREGLIAKYCPSPLAAEIKSSHANRDCLVRPYLGKRRHGGAERRSRFQASSLRNLPLHVDQMEQLGLDIETYAKLMAEALAMMHWYGEMDASDVKFVLAPPRSTAPSAKIHSAVLGEHAMWLLDFDCCRQMFMDERGVDQAVAAFFRNDSFFPRPSTRACPDQALWEIFRAKYRQASCMVGGDSTRMRLPRILVEKIEGTQWKRVENTGPLAMVEVGNETRVGLDGEHLVRQMLEPLNWIEVSTWHGMVD